MKQTENLKNDYQSLKKDLADTTKKAGAAAEDKYNEYKEKGKEVAENIGNKYNELKERGKEMAENIEERAYEMGAKAKDMMNDAEDKLKKGVSCLEDQVRAHPMVSVTAAMLVGAMLAKLFSKK
ncbi:hypothetical protein NF27_DP00790 [Candidatus Jidaibacter acanthamoeba]|uniref:DUF883 domain-containing protein n=1 Tax=Candidatus Jidaibacter acanthamoebae TaxID=86105 RepID=A0A0C1QZT8_9RICK|nr:hypothetical protein [Candidatus Jidaibacter acanthamoeba]KIE05535.1 hypothetical protein NF27_DP00790 [Candidatus Jidaibacter acanthamoeba]